MATAKDIKRINKCCDSISKELSVMKMKINALGEELRRAYGEDNEWFLANERHLTELAAVVEEKLRILTGSCPIEWKDRVRMEKAADIGEDMEFRLGP
jgi:hypothetical protein